jgi:endonuclease/exonuclease/phosphatase family metal-dependent hydrolase
VCVLGDFNQRIPARSQPAAVATALADAIPTGFVVATRDMRDAEGKLLIDHVVASNDLLPRIEKIVSRISSDGVRLTDHPGVVAFIKA